MPDWNNLGLRGPTCFQITCTLVEISFQNTKQFSKLKSSAAVVYMCRAKLVAVSECLKLILFINRQINFHIKIIVFKEL